MEDHWALIGFITMILAVTSQSYIFITAPHESVCFSNGQSSNCNASPPSFDVPKLSYGVVGQNVTCNVSGIEVPLLSSCENGVPANYSQECNFSCQTSHKLTGPSSVVCTSTGHFSEPFPECEIVTCNVSSIEDPLLSSCENGFPVNYSQECTFSCQTGYELRGPSSVNCTSTGYFSEPFPECQDIFITAPHESVCFSNGQSCNCNASPPPFYVPKLSYGVVGPNVTCNVSGIEVPLLSSCENGVPANYSQECNFSCQTSHKLTGPSSVVCTRSGHFSEPFPECEIVTCNVSSIEDPLLSSCENGLPVNYSQECTFSCQTGYELRGPSSVNCKSTGYFSKPFPECQDIFITAPHESVCFSNGQSCNCNASPPPFYVPKLSYGGKFLIYSINCTRLHSAYYHVSKRSTINGA
ncbi:P-selectin-like [Lytechinus pictus]|uniref:P-selectin-like n=1 Tax=Lytechinus pictus TaxID=7653 RepID=UPI0030B9B57B